MISAPERTLPIGSSNSNSTGDQKDSTTELDQYATEFAMLVQKYPPRRGENQHLQWLQKIPEEVFEYYRWGICSYGREAETPVEKRGRLYLMHTTLLFMWIRWGRSTAKARFRQQTSRGTQRVASLLTLELYRKAGIVETFEIGDWFWQPPQNWTVKLKTKAVSVSHLSRPSLADALQQRSVLPCNVAQLSNLRARGAIPKLSEMDLQIEDPAEVI